MRVAIFSDVHGNAFALEAVLADVERVGGVDAYWFVGDAAAAGYDPLTCVKRIAALPGLLRVRGNTDRMTVSDNPADEDSFLELAKNDHVAAKSQLAQIRGIAWTRGAVATGGAYQWLAEMPLENSVTLPDGTRVLLVHAAPGTDSGVGIQESQSDEDLATVLSGVDADLVIVGHTHRPLDRQSGKTRVWNLGSVSMPFTDDIRAMWSLLEADGARYVLSRQYAEYDVDAMLKMLSEVHHPAEDTIRSAWLGKR
jgi:predicted phosphodiesterase